VGLLRGGKLIRLIPAPVIIGFTAGIAAIIFSGQVKDFFGLAIPHLPAEVAGKWAQYVMHAGTVSGLTTAIGLLTIGIIVVGRMAKFPFPPAILGVVASGVMVWGLNLPVETIASKFGGIPQGLPQFHGADILAGLTVANMVALLPSALTIALLGGIESLLSALVADGLTGDRHKSNIELVAQGLANIASVLFGGIAATGAIARTGTNIKSGAQTPVSGMVHSVFLLGVMVFLAPLAGHIPLAALAGVLFVVSWDMSEKHHVAKLIRERKPAALIMATTLLLTVFADLTYAVVLGTLLALSFNHAHKLRHVLGGRETVALLENPEIEERRRFLRRRNRETAHPHKH
jgi:SulP family sulfate permease